MVAIYASPSARIDLVVVIASTFCVRFNAPFLESVSRLSCRLLLLFACLPVMAGEKAAYDSDGRIVSMISDAGEVEIASSIDRV